MSEEVPWEELHHSHPVDFLIAEVMKKERIDSAKRNVNKVKVESKKKRTGTTATHRLLRLFIDHPDRQFTPKEITDNHLRMKPSTCRARLNDLLESKYIRRVRDPVNNRYHWGLYELNTSEPFIHPGSAPRHFHGLKIHLQRPQMRVSLKGGKSRIVQVLPEDFKKMILSWEVSQFIRFSEKETKLKHAYVFEGWWKKRRVTITVQHGKSSLVEIWCEASEKSLDIEEFIDFNRTLALAFNDVWKESDPYYHQLGINHDIIKTVIDGVQRLKVQAVQDYMVQAYNKNGNLRIETHIYRSLPQESVMKALQGTVVEANSFFDRVDLSTLEKQNKAQAERIEDLRGRMDLLVSTLKGLGVDVNSLGKHMEVQGERVLDLIGEMSNINKVLQGLTSSTPSSGYDPPGLDDNSGYG